MWRIRKASWLLGRLEPEWRHTFSCCTSREKAVVPPSSSCEALMLLHRESGLACVSAFHQEELLLPTARGHYFAVTLASMEREYFSFAFLPLWTSENRWNCMSVPLFWTIYAWDGIVWCGDWGEAGKSDGILSFDGSYSADTEQRPFNK